MSLRHLWTIALVTVLSLVGAGIFYAAWLAAFLAFARPDGPTTQPLVWLSAPVVTALGFTAGVVALKRLRGAPDTGFLRILVWPLVGCVVGAGAVYWFGPMLIVFGMFAAGAVAVVLREVLLVVRRRERAG